MKLWTESMIKNPNSRFLAVVFVPRRLTQAAVSHNLLALRALSKIAADDTFIILLLSFEENKA